MYIYTYKQYVLELPSAIFCLYPFYKQKRQILKRINTKNNIFTYRHPFCTFNNPPLLKMGTQGPNLYIFL